MKTPMTIIKLKFMALVVDFISDWYFTRNFSQEIKAKKMARLSGTRKIITDALDLEIKESEYADGGV